MCLELTENWEEATNKLRQSNKPVIAYKMVNTDMTSAYQDFKWQLGLNISDRESVELTVMELENNEVYHGFHLVLEEPSLCLHRCLCLHQYQCPYQYRNQRPCRYQCPYNNVLKCEIQPEDIVAIGEWEGIPSIVATKVTVLSIEEK